VRRPVVLLTLLLAAVVATPATPATASAAVPGAAAVRPLHAVPDPVAGGRLVDDRGREVLLRGVNVNALAEYWKGTPFATTFPLAPQDPARMRRIGWNAVRLLISWSRVEPAPGRYDERYLALVARTARRLGREGLAVVVDAHQDAWGASLAAPAGTACPPGWAPALGWDGAPAWATADGGASRCDPGVREAVPAVLAAWRAFFADQGGVRRRFVAMWGHVARRLHRVGAVVGYDLLNEPGALDAGAQQALSGVYADALAAIRRAPGPRKLVLFEPSVAWSATGHGAPPAFRHDDDVVYAPHLYTGGFTADDPITAPAFQVARAEARGFGGAPVLSGEWGTGPERAGTPDDYFAAHQALQDRFRFSATLWTWRESCGDPHKVGDLRAGRVPEVWGLFDVDCRTNAVRGVRPALAATLTRGYVRAAPGRLASTAWDPVTRTLRGAGAGARRRAGDLVAFWPRTGGPAPHVRARGLRSVRVRGDLVLARPRGGAWSLVVGPRVTSARAASSGR
jgi:endoglycosylceramidase